MFPNFKSCLNSECKKYEEEGMNDKEFNQIARENTKKYAVPGLSPA